MPAISCACPLQFSLVCWKNIQKDDATSRVTKTLEELFQGWICRGKRFGAMAKTHPVSIGGIQVKIEQVVSSSGPVLVSGTPHLYY